MKEPHDIEAPPYDYAARTDTLGLRHIRVALADLEWPASAEELRRKVGQWRIPITGEHMHTLEEMLQGVDERRRFRNADALAKAIAEAHPQLRERG